MVPTFARAGLLALGMFTLAACGGSGSATAAPAPPAGGDSGAATGGGSLTITIKNFAFHPADATAKVGQTITVVNSDDSTHTVTASDKTFDTGDLTKGQSKTFTVGKAG
jgi:plastocyanin